LAAEFQEDRHLVDYSEQMLVFEEAPGVEVLHAL
jgi:hypothetical protein